MMQIRITVPLGGEATIHAASLLYDLWHDYVHYREQAESVDTEQESLQYKRFVRAAVHSYFSYFEGVLNTWISKLNPRNSLQ